MGESQNQRDNIKGALFQSMLQEDIFIICGEERMHSALYSSSDTEMLLLSSDSLKPTLYFLLHFIPLQSRAVAQKIWNIERRQYYEKCVNVTIGIGEIKISLACSLITPKSSAIEFVLENWAIQITITVRFRPGIEFSASALLSAPKPKRSKKSSPKWELVVIIGYLIKLII